MKILGVDPGTSHSAWIEYDREKKRVGEMGYAANSDLRERLRTWEGRIWRKDCGRASVRLAIEGVQPYGAKFKVSWALLQTAEWIGVFREAWEAGGGTPPEIVFNPALRTHLCGTVRVSSADIHQAVLRRFASNMREAKGTVKKPGPLFGVKEHIWSALAVAVYFAETGGAE